ncbi:MAG: hypothetical protein HRU19_11345 [Pseudobacteriovorax sp.]|nr:hypothetical protein [Pseudobacteriovorax sp.]
MSKKDDLNLKGPDAFQVQATRGLDFAAKNSKLLYTIAGISVVLALAAFGVNYYQTSAAQSQADALAAIDMTLEKEQKAFADKRSELEKQIDELKLAVKEKKEGADPVKLAELEKELLAAKADHTQSLSEYKNYYESNLDNPSGWVAGLRVAKNLSEKDDLAGAQSIAQAIFDQSKGYAIVRHQSGVLLVSLLEDLGKHDEAVAVASTLEKQAQSGMQPQYLLIKARNLYLAKKMDEARGVLETIIADHGTSQEADKAKGLQALLN